MSTIAAAQGIASGSDHTMIAVTGIGVLSIQPVDDSYVGGPYLDRGLGGHGFGFGGAFSVINRKGILVSAEFSTTSISASQRGRLVGGRDDSAAETRLHDSILAGLVGLSSRSRAFQAQGGVGWIIDNPTLNGTDVTAYGGEGRHVAVGGGLDVTASVAPRTEIVTGARYWFAPRSAQLEQLGVGPHIIRIGAGIRIRVQ